MNIQLSRLSQIVVFLASVCGLQTAAHADENSGLFIEPVLTYEYGNTTTNFPAPLSNSTGSAQGFGLGARVGFHIDEAFFVALDGRYSTPHFKDSSVNYDAGAVSTNWGPVVGLQMPIVGLRVWGTYILGGELNPDRSGSFDVDFKNATGYRLGAGLHVVAVSLNLEYEDLKYGETDLQSAGPLTPGTLGGTNLEDKAWIASVSFPFEL